MRSPCRASSAPAIPRRPRASSGRRSATARRPAATTWAATACSHPAGGSACARSSRRTARASPPPSPSASWVTVSRTMSPPGTTRSSQGPCLPRDARCLLKDRRARWHGDAGSSWVVADYRSTLYNHALLPNAPLSCVAADGQTAFMGASSGHVRGVNLLMLDGSVKLVLPTIDRRVWKSSPPSAHGHRRSEALGRDRPLSGARSNPHQPGSHTPCVIRCSCSISATSSASLTTALMFHRFGPRLGLTGRRARSADVRAGSRRRWRWSSSAAGSTTRSSAGPVMGLAGLEMSYEEFEAELGRHLHAQRAGRPAGRRPEAPGLHAAAGLEHQRPARPVLPPQVPRDAGPLRSLRLLVRGRRAEAGSGLLPGLPGRGRGRGRLVRLHRRRPGERRGSEGGGAAGDPLSRHAEPDRGATASGRRGPRRRGMTRAPRRARSRNRIEPSGPGQTQPPRRVSGPDDEAVDGIEVEPVDGPLDLRAPSAWCTPRREAGRACESGSSCSRGGRTRRRSVPS